MICHPELVSSNVTVLGHKDITLGLKFNADLIACMYHYSNEALSELNHFKINTVTRLVTPFK